MVNGKEKMPMDIIHPHCAGIDIGSKSHFVALGQALDDVKEFGVYADDLIDICLHLKHQGITSVAMANNKISGGKLLSSKTPKGSNRLKIAFRKAANVIGNLKDTHLSDFFRRVAYRKGRTVAISATARKLAVIIWNMIVKRVSYKPPTQYLFLDQKRKIAVLNRIKKQIDKFALTNAFFWFVNHLISNPKESVSQNIL